MLPSVKRQRHPWLEMLDHARLHLGMLVQVVVESVGKRIHQFLQPPRTVGILFFQNFRIDEQPHPQILVDFGLALGFRQPPHGIDVVGLHAIEVVLGLRVFHAEHGVGVSFAIDVRYAPIVANDGDAAGLSGPTFSFRVLGQRGGYRQQQEDGLQSIHGFCLGLL